MAAVVASCVLLLHLFVASMVDAATALPGSDPSFVICSAHGAAASPDAPSRDRNRTTLPDCCLAGCTLAAAHADIAAVPSLVPPVPQAAPPPAFAYQDSHDPGETRSPFRPRGPPAVATGFASA